MAFSPVRPEKLRGHRGLIPVETKNGLAGMPPTSALARFARPCARNS